MNRRLIVMCAVIVLAMAIPAFAAVQNVKVSGDIDAYAIYRNNFNLGRKDNGMTGGVDKSNLFMSQIRLRVDADLTDNVSTTVRLLNERDWDAENAATTDIDLDLAYVTLKEMLYSPLTVVIGRQPLRYGAGLIIGDPDTNRVSNTNADNVIFNQDLSIRKAFDAVKAILNYDPLTIDLFYSKIDENTKIGAGSLTTSNKDDVNLYGVDASYKLGDKFDTVAEGYYIYKSDDSVKFPAAGAAPERSDTILVPGARISTNPIKGLNVQIEQAWQLGNKVISTNYDRNREAMATQLIASYVLPIDALEKYAPVIGAQFTRFSGDKNAAATGNDDYKAWDPMYEDQGTGTIYNVLFQTTNTKVANGNVSIKPIEDLSLKLNWTGIWLDQDLNIDRWGNANANLYTLYQLNNGTYTPTMSAGKKFLGQEVDATLTYDYTEDVQLGLMGGAFAPGKAFAKPVNSDDSRVATQVIGSCKVTF
ncbi:MAG: alginate export family protein [Candidatus Omnitrophota bacterium]|nr:alginate export family protein [Candidatus Omnitrophota bacterium]